MIPLVGVLVVALALVFALLYSISNQLDSESEARSVAFTQLAWSERTNAQSKLLSDYAGWGDAYANLHTRVNLEWAYTQGNLGRSLFERFDFGYIFVIAPDGRTVYAVIDGVLANVRAGDVMQGDLRGLVAKAAAAPANETQVISDVLSAGGDPVIVSAGAFSTGGDGSIPQQDGPPSVLILGERLSPAALDKLGRATFVNGLRVARNGDDARAAPSLRIGEGASAFTLRWDPERPGTRLLEAFLPWLALTMGAIVALLALAVRSAMKAAALAQSGAAKLAEAYRDAEHQALHDPTTGLPNRSMLTKQMTEALSREGSRFAVLYLDLDRFKSVNDGFGYPVGDLVLNEVAKRLCKVVRGGDLVARVGGDKFVMMVRRIDGADVEALCRRLLEAIRHPIEVKSHVVHVGLSIGVALAPEDASDAEGLLRRSGIALHQTKSSGGGAYRFFASEMNDQILKRRGLEADMRRGLDADEFFLLYQPRYDARSMRIRSVEALVRWHHPERGLIGPAEFIPLAEETGLIAPLGVHVLRLACRQAIEWPEIGVSVNVSPVQFRGPDFVAMVSEALSVTGLSPARLELELTEGVLLEDTERAGLILNSLKARGIQLSMDDFGTGYSSLGYLKRFPFDAIKIDRSFIADLHAAGESRAIVQAILGLGRALGISVTAEGVETAEQLALLRLDGCDEVQGFHMAHPSKAEDIPSLFAMAEAATGSS
ncbi:MAG TPA: EAL domain-containing protein [Hansschlegelia sp.]